MSSLVPLALAVVGAPVAITAPVVIARHLVYRHADAVAAEIARDEAALAEAAAEIASPATPEETR